MSDGVFLTWPELAITLAVGAGIALVGHGSIAFKVIRDGFRALDVKLFNRDPGKGDRGAVPVVEANVLAKMGDLEVRIAGTKKEIAETVEREIQGSMKNVDEKLAAMEGRVLGSTDKLVSTRVASLESTMGETIEALRLRVDAASRSLDTVAPRLSQTVDAFNAVMPKLANFDADAVAYKLKMQMQAFYAAQEHVKRTTLDKLSREMPRNPNARPTFIDQIKPLAELFLTPGEMRTIKKLQDGMNLLSYGFQSPLGGNGGPQSWGQPQMNAPTPYMPPQAPAPVFVQPGAAPHFDMTQLGAARARPLAPEPTPAPPQDLPPIAPGDLPPPPDEPEEDGAPPDAQA